jgi:2'-5' RNA ligase
MRDMSLLVLAYPQLPEHDLRWIEDVRATHDPLHDVVRAHITLVFHVRSVSAEHLIEHVRTITRSVQPFAVVFRGASVVKDAVSDQTNVVLVPDEGNGALVKLHDRLYTGLLTSELRLDIPYIPHITVGGARDPLACKALADELNSREFRLAGTLAEIDVVRYEAGQVDTLVRLPLG